MVDCNDADSQRVSGAFPGTQDVNDGALQVNLTADADSIFNPNNALSAVNTYLSMNNVANRMFGIDARWFRAVPQDRSIEVILKEWTLYNVAEVPICLKVLLPDGNFPESSYQFDLMGLEYEVPLTIHIDKKYWEEMAGWGTAPQKKDVVYLSLPNKLYEVESSYLERGFMEQETHYVLNLRKYQTAAARKESAALQDTIDKYTVGEEELFGEELQDQYDKITDDKQFSPFNSTSQDKYKSIDSSISIITQNIEIHGLMVAEGYYDMSTTSNYNAIIYNTGDIIEATDDRAITAWFNSRESTNPAEREYKVLSIEKDLNLTLPANYKIRIDGTTRDFAIGDTFVITRGGGAINFYATVIDDSDSSDGTYYCQIDSEVEIYLNSIYPNWANARNYSMKVQPPITILDGVNDTVIGWAALVYANQYVKIIYGTQTRVAAFSEQIDFNTWYGIGINMGNSTSTYNVNIWEIDENNPDTKISVKLTDTLPFVPEKATVGTYSVDRSNAYITNIRLFSTIIEDDEQRMELLSYFTKDSDQAIILDNADRKFLAPYISQQR